MDISFILLIIAGFITGFLFSMPVMGPISILVTTKGLSGNFKGGMLTAAGAGLADAIYVFIAVTGFSKIIGANHEAIPYILITGAAFVFYIGMRMTFSQKEVMHFSEMPEHEATREMKRIHNDFITGFLINILNPTLFFGWITATLIVVSIILSVGITITNSKPHGIPDLGLLKGMIYGLSVGMGSTGWFWLYLKILAKVKISSRLLNTVIKILGVALIVLSFYLIYKAYQLSVA